MSIGLVDAAWAQDDTAATETDGASQSSELAPATQADDRWKISVTPYLWLAAMDGDIGVRAREVSIDQSFDDVIDLLKEDLNFGASVHLELEKGRWGLFVDALYMDIGAEQETAIGTQVDLQLQQFIGELGGFYTLVQPDSNRPNVRLDLLGGVRFTWLEVELDPENLDARNEEKGWIDPFIGARVATQLTSWLSIFARGDIGGFGIDSGTTSELVWNVITGADFRLSDCCSMALGYRWLSYDYEDGDFRFDMMLHGPFFGGTIRF